MNETFMLTTFDNPFNPFDDFINWYMFDVEKGYNSSAYIGRLINLSDSMTEKEQNEEQERVIDLIIKNDFTNNYRKVKESDFKKN